MQSAISSESKYFVVDIWLEIASFLAPDEYLVIRQICRWFWSFTRLTRLWYQAYKLAITGGFCPVPDRPSLLQTLPSHELERRLLHSLAMERKLLAERSETSVLSFDELAVVGRPYARITWIRLVSDLCVLEATSDGFLQCLSVPSMSKRRRMELLGQWTGFGVVTSGCVLIDDMERDVDLALATEDLDSPRLYLIRLSINTQDCTEPVSSLQIISQSEGSSDVLALSRDLICAATYEGRNLMHVLRRSSGAMIRLVSPDERPQAVHSAMIAAEVLLAAKVWVVELYSIGEIMSDPPHDVYPIRIVRLPHMSWSAVSVDFGYPSRCLGIKTPPVNAFGILSRWHEGLTLYALTWDAVAHLRNDEDDNFMFSQQAHISIPHCVRGLAIGTSGFRASWIESNGRGTSNLMTSTLSRLPSPQGECIFGLSPPRCLWTGSPPGVLDHCSFVGLNEPSGAFLVSQLETGHSWVLLPVTRPKHLESAMPESAQRIIDSHWIYRLMMSAHTLPPYQSVTIGEDPFLGRAEYARQEAEAIRQHTYNVPRHLLLPGYSNDWGGRLSAKWFGSPGDLLDRIKRIKHIPGRPRLIMHGPYDVMLLEIDNWIFLFDDEEGILKYAPRSGSLQEFLQELSAGRVVFQEPFCSDCRGDLDVLDADDAWQQDHSLVSRVVDLALVAIKSRVPVDTAKHEKIIKAGLAAADRLMMSARHGILREPVGLYAWRNAWVNERMLHDQAARLTMTISHLPLS